MEWDKAKGWRENDRSFNRQFLRSGRIGRILAYRPLYRGYSYRSHARAGQRPIGNNPSDPSGRGSGNTNKGCGYCLEKARVLDGSPIPAFAARPRHLLDSRISPQSGCGTVLALCPRWVYGVRRFACVWKKPERQLYERNGEMFAQPSAKEVSPAWYSEI